jgi:hypothetical protein
MKARTLLAAALFLFPFALRAQENGQWRAASTTARGVTGDIAFTETKIAINFSGFTLAQIRPLEPGEMDAIFQAGHDAAGKGNLFRTEIPGDKRFAHKNTLCGSEDVQWVVTWVNGKSLQMAMFSGAAMPRLTPEALANTTALCGTFGYVR